MRRSGLDWTVNSFDFGLVVGAEGRAEVVEFLCLLVSANEMKPCQGQPKHREFHRHCLLIHPVGVTF